MKSYAELAIGQVESSLIDAATTARQNLIEGLAQGDAARIVSNYGADAIVFVPGIVNRETTLLIGWQDGINQGIRLVTVEPTELTQASTLGYESGAYSILDPQGTAIEQGYFVIVWRKEAAGWKWHRHIWTWYMRAGS